MTDCNNNSNFSNNISDKNIVYTGVAIPSLGICTGDSLAKIEGILLQKLTDFASAIGISVPSIDLTTCPAFSSCLTCCDTCTDLACLLDCYKNAICGLYTQVQTLQTDVNALKGPYNIGCLDSTKVNSASTLSAIVQELILEFCNLITAFNALNSTVGGLTAGINTTIGNFLSTALGSCQGPSVLNKTGTGASTTFSLRGFTPVGGLIAFAGTTSGRFDSTGLGIAGTDACGWAIANGNNGTVNMTGQVPVGLTNMGGTLPSNASGLILTATGAQIGEAGHILTAPESGNPGNSVTVTDPGHRHAIYFAQDSCQSGLSSRKINPIDPTFNANGASDTIPAVPSDIHIIMSHEFTGIAVSNTAVPASKAHNNIQPSTGVLFIQRVS